MKFCPKCGTKLSVASESSKIKLHCWKCGYKDALDDKETKIQQNPASR